MRIVLHQLSGGIESEDTVDTGDIRNASIVLDIAGYNKFWMGVEMDCCDVLEESDSLNEKGRVFFSALIDEERLDILLVNLKALKKRFEKNARIDDEE